MTNESYAGVSFFIVPHADDWQLFMQPNAYTALLAPGQRVVFIITTAGDAGSGERYWKAREEGCKSSIRFCLAPHAALTELNGVQQFNDHPIYYWLVNNVICYFLRLPDGNLDGTGFPGYNHQSLSKFRKGEVDALSAVDNTTTYNSWDDLCATLQMIITAESSGNPNARLHYLNPCTSANPHDHADHIATGQVVQAIDALAAMPQALYMGYHSGQEGKPVSVSDYFWKAGMFAAYEKAVYDASGYSTLQEDVQLYLRWCARGASFVTVNWEY